MDDPKVYTLEEIMSLDDPESEDDNDTEDEDEDEDELVDDGEAAYDTDFDVDRPMDEVTDDEFERDLATLVALPAVSEESEEIDRASLYHLLYTIHAQVEELVTWKREVEAELTKFQESGILNTALRMFR